MILKAAKFLKNFYIILNVYLQKKKTQFSPLYTYQKFQRSGQKFQKRSQAIEQYFKN